MFSTIGRIIIIPFAAILRLFYKMTGSYGWSLVLFTLVVKLILLPFQLKSKKSMLRMGRMQPKIQELQARYATNKEKQNEELAKLYQEEGINPMSGCLWSFLPFPILIALYSVIRKPLSNFMMLGSETVAAITAEVAKYHEFQSAATYQEIEVARYVHDHFGDFSAYVPEGLMRLDYQFLGVDLSAIPWNYRSMIGSGGWAVIGLMLIAILAGVTSLLMSVVTMKSSGNTAAGSNKMMMYLMPLMSVYIAFIMPAALGIYWIANNIFSMLQEVLLNKYYGKLLDKEEEERNAKKAAARKFRQEEARKQALEEKKNPPAKKEKKPAASEETKEKKESTTENGRVGDRPYARGRAYKEDHYNE